MEKIRIITDSGADFVAPFPKNLTVLPLTIRFGEEEYRDGVDLDHRTFYEKLLSGKELPKTSLISPAEFEAAFDAARAAGETVVAILISSRLSGTWQSAVLAADGRETVHVVDSMNATLGQQALVKYALRLADQGLTAQQLVTELERIKSHVRLTGVPASLEYLHRGGRISKATAILGGALSIKPVLRLIDGEVVMVGKARGTKQADASLAREVEKTGLDASKPVCLGYTGLRDDALRRFIADSGALWENVSYDLCSVGATIGTHIGPDSIVVAYFDASAPELTPANIE